LPRKEKEKKRKTGTPHWRGPKSIACPITPCVGGWMEKRKGVKFSATMQQETKILSSSCGASSTTY